MNELDKVDAIRERTGVSYRTAKEALDRADGDVVSALINLEEETAEGQTWQKQIKVTGNELVQKVESLIQQGNVRRIIVRHQGRTLMEIPVTVGVIGALLMPTLAALGAVAAMVSECTVVVEHADQSSDWGTCGDQHPLDGSADQGSGSVL